MSPARRLIAALGLQPHPEGGWYRETWRAEAAPGARAAGTAIYYLLEADQFSHWHRVDAAEIWHFYAGAPLELSIDLSIERADGSVTKRVLGTALFDGEEPQLEVPAGAWQRARSLGPWTLVGCTVRPGFLFEKFEIRD
jgi:predicted cupin superfamily sugar epimerase